MSFDVDVVHQFAREFAELRSGLPRRFAPAATAVRVQLLTTANAKYRRHPAYFDIRGPARSVRIPVVLVPATP